MRKKLRWKIADLGQCWGLGTVIVDGKSVTCGLCGGSGLA